MAGVHPIEGASDAHLAHGAEVGAAALGLGRLDHAGGRQSPVPVAQIEVVALSRPLERQKREREIVSFGSGGPAPAAAMEGGGGG